MMNKVSGQKQLHFITILEVVPLSEECKEIFPTGIPLYKCYVLIWFYSGYRVELTYRLQ
jgi:hypothetical protein